MIENGKTITRSSKGVAGASKLGLAHDCTMMKMAGFPRKETACQAAGAAIMMLLANRSSEVHGRRMIPGRMGQNSLRVGRYFS